VNDRKRAWQILHTEISRRERGIPTEDAWSAQIGTLIRDAHSVSDIIIELAGFGATFAQMSAAKNTRPGDAVDLADKFGLGVMQEPDEDEDEESI
jgi:hypothetical protein